MFLLKTLYTTIMYQVKMFLILFLVAFFCIKPSFGQENSPKDEIVTNYWGFVEPVLRCQAAHNFMIQQTFDYSYMLGFFNNTDPTAMDSVTDFLQMINREIIFLENIKKDLKDIAVPKTEYTVDDRKAVLDEMINIEREETTKFYISWYQSRSISNNTQFQQKVKQTMSWCISQRSRWNQLLGNREL